MERLGKNTGRDIKKEGGSGPPNKPGVPCKPVNFCCLSRPRSVLTLSLFPSAVYLSLKTWANSARGCAFFSSFFGFSSRDLLFRPRKIWRGCVKVTANVPCEDGTADPKSVRFDCFDHSNLNNFSVFK